METWHTVIQGETFSSLADANGFSDPKTLYNHRRNKDLRSKRSNPNIIFPGDCIYIPDRETKCVPAATDQRHKFVFSLPYIVLRICLQDFSGKPFVKTKYEVQLGLSLFAGITDGKGILEERIPVQAKEATLKIGQYQWTLKIGQLNPIDETPDSGASGIQQRLCNLGFDPGPIDGIIGPRTKTAIEAFQKKHPPLEVNGVCTPQTIQRLAKEHSS